MTRVELAVRVLELAREIARVWIPGERGRQTQLERNDVVSTMLHRLADDLHLEGGAMHFEIYKQGTGWRFRLKGGNGEIVASGSEAYSRKSDALRAVALVVSTTAATPVREVEA